MAQIGLIAAMDEECRPLLWRVQGVEKYRLGSFNAYQFQLAGHACVLVQSGIGLKRAGAATRALLAALHPQRLVSFGVAGAVKDGLNIGDVVSVTSTTLLEDGAAGQSARLAALSEPARLAIAGALRPRRAQIFSGKAYTTRGSQLILADTPDSDYAVLEMETSAIAQAAAEANLPLLGLRGISDNPMYPLPIDPEMVMDENYHLQAGKLLRTLIRHPEILLTANRMRRNTAIAAENTAIAVIAALSKEND